MDSLNPLARVLQRLKGKPDGMVHVGKGRLPGLGKALTADVERRLREFSDDDPTGKPCGGCLMMSLIAAAEGVADVASQAEFGTVSDTHRAAFLSAVADAMQEAADFNRERGKRWTDGVRQVDH